MSFHVFCLIVFNFISSASFDQITASLFSVANFFLQICHTDELLYICLHCFISACIALSEPIFAARDFLHLHSLCTDLRCIITAVRPSQWTDHHCSVAVTVDRSSVQCGHHSGHIITAVRPSQWTDHHFIAAITVDRSSLQCGHHSN